MTGGTRLGGPPVPAVGDGSIWHCPTCHIRGVSVGNRAWCTSQAGCVRFYFVRRNGRWVAQ